MTTLLTILVTLAVACLVFAFGACVGVAGTDRLYAGAARNRIAISRGGRLYHVIDVTATDGPPNDGQVLTFGGRAAAKPRKRWTFGSTNGGQP